MLSYNEFWYERGNQLTEDKRTSLVVDPPDGRIPFTEAARQRNAENLQKSNSGFADSYTDRSLADRCIMGFNSGPPMISGAYNNNLQILQAPGYVVIVNEMIHNTRIIPTDGVRTASFVSMRATPVAAGKATRWWSRRPTSFARPA